MLNGLRLGLVACAFVVATPVSAATIVQTASSGNGPAFVNPFNASAGTLNRVTVQSSFFQNLYFNYASQLGDPIISAVGRIGSVGLGFADFSGQYQSGRQDPQLITLRIAGTATEITTAGFEQFTRGPVFLSGLLADASFTVDGQELRRASPSFPGQVGGQFIVTYDFTPAIPEPATWALMFAGFAMTGYALRRRRASVAFA